MTDNDKIVSDGKFSKIYNKSKNLIGIAQKINNLYVMKSLIDKNIDKINAL